MLDLTRKDVYPTMDKLRMQIYNDTSDLTYDYMYVCYTLPNKLLAEETWAIEKYQKDKTGTIVARYYANLP